MTLFSGDSDMDIEEHFRRSLGQHYSKLTPDPVTQGQNYSEASNRIRVDRHSPESVHSSPSPPGEMDSTKGDKQAAVSITGNVSFL